MVGGGGGGEGGGRGSSNATVDGVTEWSGLTEREREEWASQSAPLGQREAAAKQSEVKHETPESPLLLLSHYPIEWRRGDSFSSVAL